MKENPICNLFGIKYPIVSGGMVWCSGWKLASAVSNCGGLGLLGAGSMHPDNLAHHIDCMKQATDKPFGVNIPLLYPEMDRIIEIILQKKVPIVFTSAGSPKKWTPLLKENGITVVHVVSSSTFAKKSEEAGVDAVVAEGFEAGGHNGREETTTMTLIPSVRKSVSIPVLAAGGIGSGQSIAAAMALGANGVQMGSRFAIAKESSAHDAFKHYVVAAKEGDTKLSLKALAPVRLLKNQFAEEIQAMERRGDSPERLREFLSKGRAKKGMFEGDLANGELEIGQVSAHIDQIQSVEQIFEQILHEYRSTYNGLTSDLDA